MLKAKISEQAYEVPKDAVETLNKFIEEVWEPNIPKSTPSSMKSLSWTTLLADWARDNWQPYKVSSLNKEAR